MAHRRYRRRARSRRPGGGGRHLPKSALPPAIPALQALRGPDGRYILDVNTVYHLAQWGLQLDETAAMMGLSVNSFRDNLNANPEMQAAFDRGRAVMIAGLRYTQIRMALDGHPTMLIWTGKQYLGQADRHESETTHTHRLEVHEQVHDQVREKLGAFLRNREVRAEDLEGMPQLPARVGDQDVAEAEIVELDQASGGS